MTSRDYAAIEADLLPCPFCGGEASMSDPHGAFSRLAAVYCEACEIKGPLRGSADNAAEAWNTRQPTTPTTGEDEVERVAADMERGPLAYLKFWFDHDGNPRCRVDMTDVCEPLLASMKPTITPLYALAAISPTTEDAEKRALVGALTRLSSMEAFTTSRNINPNSDAELLARIDFARALLASIGERS